MYVKILISVALIATCQSGSLKGKTAQRKFKDLNIPGRYGDTPDDSSIPGRYGDSLKKSSSMHDDSTAEKNGIPGRYGDYSKKSSFHGNYDDNSIRGYLKKNNDYDNKLFEDNSMYHKYVMLTDEPQPNLPGRYAGDEVNTNNVYTAEVYDEEADQRDTAVNKRHIPGRYGDEELRPNKDIPGRYGDAHDDADSSTRYGERKSKKNVKQIPGRYGDERKEMDETIIPGRYGDGNKKKDNKKIPSRYGDERFFHIQKRHGSPKDNRLIPGRYGDERMDKNVVQSNKKYAGKYSDEIYISDITSNKDVIPGRYGDDNYRIDIPGRYGDETAYKYILSEVNDEEPRKLNVKKKPGFRYKFDKTRFANQGPSTSTNKRNTK